MLVPPEVFLLDIAPLVLLRLWNGQHLQRTLYRLVRTGQTGPLHLLDAAKTHTR